jgi:hypothetical protein
MSNPSRFLGTLLLSLAGLLAACGGGGGDGGGAGGGGGGARTIGLDSSVAPNSGVRCIDGPPLQDGSTQFPNLQFPWAGMAGSCTILTFSAQDPGNGGPGTVTQANIRVGNATGPMRFVRLRNLWQNRAGNADGSQCCAIMEYGAVFTPAVNSVTTVPLNFRMTWEPRPPATDFTTVIAQDRVGLEVLNPNTPIPGVWTRNGLPEIGTNATFIWLPSISNQGYPAGAVQMPNRTTSYSGFVPSFNYNFVPG